jgi:hypothetical protein
MDQERARNGAAREQKRRQEWRSGFGFIYLGDVHGVNV